MLALMSIGIACGLVASLSANDPGHASGSANRNPENVRDPRPTALRQPALAASTLDVLQRFPESLRASLQAIKSLSSKDACRVAENLLREPAVARIDAIAHYLSKDVHRWSDRMIYLYLNADPKLAKAADKNEMQKHLLQKWESDRGMAKRWLQGCGVVVRAAIGRSRPAIERETPAILSDIVSVIAVGLRKNEPDAIAAAEALARIEENLQALLN
jgi:hypothetical protein